MRAQRRNSRCTALAAGGTLLAWRPDYFCGCRGTLPSLNSGRINDPTGWGAMGAGICLCSPHAFAFPARSSEKLGAAPLPPGWELGSAPPICPGSARLPPPPGDAARRGGGKLCKGEKKEQKAMGKGGGKRRQEPTPSGRERRACQLALGSSQPSGGAVRAGFPPREERMEPHPAPGRRGSSGCAGGCSGDAPWDAPGDARGAAGTGAPRRDAGASRGNGCSPIREEMRALLGAWMHPRGAASIPGRDGCTARGMQAFLGAGMGVLQRMDAPREGVNAPPSLSTAGPGSSALLRGARRRLGMSRASQPRPPCAEVRCSSTRVGSEARAVRGWGLRDGHRRSLGVSHPKLLSAGQAEPSPEGGGEPPVPYRPAQAV